jgi:uncharacterized membrane protein YoaK (UPF0700 family)
MRGPLILRPPWQRFVVWASFLAVTWGVLTSLQSHSEFESTVLSAICFGAALGGYFTIATQSVYRAALEALSGLDESVRSQSIDAVAHGAVPNDPNVRAAATRLGRVLLRNKSADQLRRTEKWAWVTYVVVLAGFAVGAVSFSEDRRYFVVLAVLWAIVIPISMRRSRRIRRNVALLAGSPN